MAILYVANMKKGTWVPMTVETVQAGQRESGS